MRSAYKILVGKSQGKIGGYNLLDLVLDGKIILKLILYKQVVKVWTGFG